MHAACLAGRREPPAWCLGPRWGRSGAPDRGLSAAAGRARGDFHAGVGCGVRHWRTRPRQRTRRERGAARRRSGCRAARCSLRARPGNRSERAAAGYALGPCAGLRGRGGGPIGTRKRLAGARRARGAARAARCHDVRARAADRPAGHRGSGRVGAAGGGGDARNRRRARRRRAAWQAGAAVYDGARHRRARARRRSGAGRCAERCLAKLCGLPVMLRMVPVVAMARLGVLARRGERRRWLHASAPGHVGDADDRRVGAARHGRLPRTARERRDRDREHSSHDEADDAQTPEHESQATTSAWRPSPRLRPPVGRSALRCRTARRARARRSERARVAARW